MIVCINRELFFIMRELCDCFNYEGIVRLIFHYEGIV